MTEAEWDASTDPTPMLEFLRSKASDRKRWLFVAASSRSETHFLPAEVRQLIAAIAEGLADGAMTLADWGAALEAIVRFMERLIAVRDFERAAILRDIRDMLFPRAYRWPHQESATRTQELERCLAGAHGRAFRAERWTLAAQCTSAWAGWDRDYMERPPFGPPAWTAASRHQQFQCRAFRDLIGSPFRPVAITPAWTAWNDGAIRKFAQTTYDERAFGHLPLLADALEDAGCTDAAILSHCRGSGEHVRGCWVVDLLLGKE